MKVIELLSNVNVIKYACEQDMEITGVSYDSRKVEPGNVFVAVAGFRTDGHKYIAQAVEKGAALVVCETPPEISVPYALVGDSRLALAKISDNFFHHPAQDLKVIGVTGTNGKTTVTMLGLMGTNANFIGGQELPAERTTPESYEVFSLLSQMKEAGCEYAVMEVSSHALALDRVYGVQFETGVFTNFSRDHLDFHETMENYLEAKSRLFSVCRYGVVNLDDGAAEKLLKSGSCQFQTYSVKSDGADLVAKNVNLKADRVEFEAVVEGSISRISLGIPGMFSVYNALAAAACCLTLGLSLADIAVAMRHTPGVKGRAEVVPTPADYTVVIDYAHSPDSVQNILKAVRGFAKGRVIALFGCGGDRDRTKRPLMGKAAAELADFCIVTSDNPRSEDPRAIIEEILPGMKGAKSSVTVIDDRRAAIVHALDSAKAGDVVVLMGKGHETYQEIDGVKHHLDEREEVAKYFAGKEKA